MSRYPGQGTGGLHATLGSPVTPPRNFFFVSSGRNPKKVRKERAHTQGRKDKISRSKKLGHNSYQEQAQFRYKGAKMNIIKMQEVGGVDPDGETPGGSAQRM